MTADRARSVAMLSGSLMGTIVLIAAHSQAEQVLLPPAPEAAAPPAPGFPAQDGPGLQQPEGNDEHDVLTRGPIHEAFAEQYNADPVAGLTIPKPPPAAIDEVPPETMPEGNNIQWVPGYWGWDDERQDFIWISGLWRDIPPGQRWVPGYWNQTGDGYQWVSGFWTSAETTELEYLPQPPQSLEQGPNIAAPSDNQFWVPGTWNYVDTGYRWRPGYWAPAYDDWVWVPDRYVWTPYGFVFGPGYYDYRLPVRAVAFAPVFFPHVHYWRHHPFVPAVVLDVGPLTMHWFVRPSYCHYYFGDYYAASYYTGWGLQPWYTCNVGFGGFGGWRGRHCHYDPLLVFYTGYHRRHHGIDFGDRMHRWHDHYQNHEEFRPRRTAREQEVFLAKMQRDGRHRDNMQNVKLGRTLDDFAAHPTEHDQKFVKIDGRQRERHTKVAQETVQLATFRHDAESGAGNQQNDSDGKRRRNKSGDVVTLPDVADANPNGGNGDNSRHARKLKLPGNQGAGDQTVINDAGNGDSNRRSRKNKVPDGPPGGAQPSPEGGNSNGAAGDSSSRRNRGRNLSDSDSDQNGNQDRQNSNSKRGRRSPQNDPLQSDPSPITGNDNQNSGASGAANPQGSSRGRNRGGVGNQAVEQPFGGHPPAIDGSSNPGSGSAKNRNPRRGNSGGGANNGPSELNIQPLQQGGGGGGSNTGNTDGGKTRSRRGNGSGSPPNFKQNGTGSSSGGSQNFENGGSNSGNSNNGNSNRSGSRRNNGGNSGSSNPAGANSSGSIGPSNPSGKSRGQNQGGNGGGGDGRNRKNRKSGN